VNDNDRPPRQNSAPPAPASLKTADQPAAPNRHGISLPWDVAGRILLLFGALCLVKLIMLIGLQKYLFQVHWRVGSTPLTWVNVTAFGVFVVLLGLNLWQFAARCSPGGARVVRIANLGILILGAWFILITFHAGSNNYLYPTLNGTLTFWDLRSYLSLAFFFQAPFLSVWLFVYALIYYGLVRTGREHLALYVTSIFATIYTALFLRDLISYQLALLVADCLGLTTLFAGRQTDRSTSWFWLTQPWIWAGFFFLLFIWSGDIQWSHEFFIITGWGMVLLAGASGFAWRRKFHPAWLWLTPIAGASLLLLTNINYFGAANFRDLASSSLTWPRYFLGEFSVAAALLGVALMYRRWLPRSSLIWLDVVNLLLIALAVADLRLTQIMGERLDWHAIELGADVNMIIRMAQPFLPGIVIGLVFVIGLYAVAVGLWQRADAKRPLVVGAGGRFWLAAFLSLGMVGSWFVASDKAEGVSALLLAKTSPLFNHAIHPAMDDKTFIAAARQLGMTTMLERPMAVPTRAPRDMNVVLIFQESSYNKYLSLFDGKIDTQPSLSKYKDSMELFPNFFCSFAGSIYARFATFTGLYPVPDYKAFTTIPVPVKSMFEVLHQNGYTCSLFDSCFFDYSSFRDFLARRGLDAMYDADTMPGPRKIPPVSWGLKEETTVDAIREQIKKYATQKTKFFLTYAPVAPHNPFDGTPAQFNKYKLDKIGDYTPLYLNELLYMDWNITSILDELKASGLLDHTLVIITADHGEMLGQDGGPIGHGWAVTPELANIPLIIMDPGHPGYHLNDRVGSQVDLLPTLLDLLGLTMPQDQLYQGRSLYAAPTPTDRKIYLSSLRQYGVIQDHRLLCGDRTVENQTATNIYTIANHGAQTLFPQAAAPDGFPANIRDFDEFQANFIQNYSRYCQALRPMATVGPGQ
jgi:phosphoglycerol transferase MdoB-like AlkP superfamily enzyme